MGSGEYMIVVDRAIKVYESRGEKITALREVSLRVPKRSVYTIMGPSGSGKTTLLNLIGGIDKPTAGTIIVDNINVSRLTGEDLRKYRLHKIGYVFQSYNLVPTLTALENVLLPMTLAGRPDKGRALDLLRQVGLEGLEKRFPEELSGGQQQRLAIAVALANDPPVIIADEPTGELDLATGERIVKLLLDQRDRHGKTVLITTHDPRVARMTDKVILLEDGRILGEYEPSKIHDIAGGTATGEVSAERVIVEYIKKRLAELNEEMRRLADAFARGEIDPDTFEERYRELKTLQKAFQAELSRLGAGPEAL